MTSEGRRPLSWTSPRAAGPRGHAARAQPAARALRPPRREDSPVRSLGGQEDGAAAGSRPRLPCRLTSDRRVTAGH